MEQKRINIAVDGYSSCGKSTIAKGLAKAIGYTYIDSGAMYRAVALYCIDNQLINKNAIDEQSLRQQTDHMQITFKLNSAGISDTYLNGVNVEHRIRTLEVADAASRVSAIRFVREAMVKLQQEMGKNKGVVMDGRDIGTVVFPDAELKLFVTASSEIRAERRYKELLSKGMNGITYAGVLANINERDERDTQRKESPLRMAAGAILLDSSNMSVDEQLDYVLNLYNELTTQ